MAMNETNIYNLFKFLMAADYALTALRIVSVAQYLIYDKQRAISNMFRVSTNWFIFPQFKNPLLTAQPARFKPIHPYFGSVITSYSLQYSLFVYATMIRVAVVGTET